MAADELGAADPRPGIGQTRAHIEEALWLTNRHTEPDAGISVGELRADRLTSELLKLPQPPGRPSSYGVHMSDSASDTREWYDPRGFVDDPRQVSDDDRALEGRFVDLLANSDIDAGLRRAATELIPFQHLSRGGDAVVDAYYTVEADARRATEPNRFPSDEASRLRQELQGVTCEVAAAVLARHSDQALRRLESAADRNLSDQAVERIAGALKGHAQHTREGVKELFGPTPGRAKPAPLQAAARSFDQGAAQPAGDDTPTVELPGRPDGPQRRERRNPGMNQSL